MAKPTRVALYLRVSKADQTTDNQALALRSDAERRGWTVTGVYDDHGVSGAKFGRDRPELMRLLSDARRRRFDVMMAWSIDRVGRSTASVLSVMSDLEACGVAQVYSQQGIDSSTPAGRAMIEMAAVFATFERGIIVERVKAGLERAKRQGTRSGKAIGRPKTDPAIEAKIATLLAAGNGIQKTAKKLGVGVSVVQRVRASA
jgi:DNA invertase Pin-like site-specific DNA recombinase